MRRAECGRKECGHSIYAFTTLVVTSEPRSGAGSGGARSGLLVGGPLRVPEALRGPLAEAAVVLLLGNG